MQNTSNFEFDDQKESIDFKKQDEMPNTGLRDSENTSSDLKELSVDLEPKWIPESEKVFEIDHPHSVSVFDVAAYILKKLGLMTTMKLQKLVYYCQAWSLVWDEAHLFQEPIEAWANGPVIRALFSYHRGLYSIPSIPIGNPDLLNDNQKETINAVLDFYGDKSSQWLIDLTHLEEPWKKARTGLSDMERGSKVIKLDDIAEYYSSLPPNN